MSEAGGQGAAMSWLGQNFAWQEVWSAGLESNLPEEELWAGNWLPLPFLGHTDGDFKRAEVVAKWFFYQFANF